MCTYVGIRDVCSCVVCVEGDLPVYVTRAFMGSVCMCLVCVHLYIYADAMYVCDIYIHVTGMCVCTS